MTATRRVVLVTGLSGAGKTSILHTLEDLGYQAIDNLPLSLIRALVAREDQSVAIGVDARTRDFTGAALRQLLADLRAIPALQPELVFATASEDALLRRYTETRRRHPLAPTSPVIEGIRAEAIVMTGLRETADLLVDTSDLPSPMLRQVIEARFSSTGSGGMLTVSLVSFAYPHGLPREADLVFDARFLRNPHYVPSLRLLTGLDPAIAAYITEDVDFQPYFDRILDLLQLLLPRFVQEGKRYVTIGIGCTGGRHRSVHIVEMLTTRLALAGWRATRTHRELANASPATALAAIASAAIASPGSDFAAAVPMSADRPYPVACAGKTATDLSLGRRQLASEA